MYWSALTATTVIPCAFAPQPPLQPPVEVVREVVEQQDPEQVRAPETASKTKDRSGPVFDKIKVSRELPSLPHILLTLPC